MSRTTAGDVRQARACIEAWIEPDPLEDDEWPSMDVLGMESSTRLAIAHFKLSCPELVNYRNGWFLKSGFDESIADGWFATEGIAVGNVEAVMNHLHIQKDLFGASRADNEMMSGEEAMACGKILAYQWKTWARDAYNLDIDVFLFKAEDGDADVQIWFTSKGSHELLSDTL